MPFVGPGAASAQSIHPVRVGTSVACTAGYARNAIVHQGRLDPGVELLPKPFTRAQLGERIRTVLDTPAVPTGDRVALIVEDEPLVRMVLADTLENLGFQVVQSASAREGMASAERLVALRGAFIDVGLPDRSGIELARDLRSRWPERVRHTSLTNDEVNSASTVGTWVPFGCSRRSNGTAVCQSRAVYYHRRERAC